MRDDDHDRAPFDLDNTVPKNNAKGSMKLADEELPDGSIVPTLHVMYPGHDAPTVFRNKAFVIPEDCEDDGDQVYCLLINAKGEIWMDATTGEPCLIPAAPALLRFDDQKHVKVSDAAKFTGRSRTSIWRAVESGELEATGSGRKKSIAIEALKNWKRRGFPTGAAKK